MFPWSEGYKGWMTVAMETASTADAATKNLIAAANEAGAAARLKVYGAPQNRRYTPNVHRLPITTSSYVPGMIDLESLTSRELPKLFLRESGSPSNRDAKPGIS